MKEDKTIFYCPVFKNGECGGHLAQINGKLFKCTKCGTFIPEKVAKNLECHIRSGSIDPQSFADLLLQITHCNEQNVKFARKY